MKKNCSIAHAVSVTETHWYRCDLSSTDGGFIRERCVEPPSDSTVVLLIGAAFLSWRESEGGGRVPDRGQFMFLDESLVMPDQLVWSKPDFINDGLTQAWIPRSSWDLLISKFAHYRIVAVLAEPISIRWDEVYSVRSGEVLLCYRPDALAATIEESLGSITEISEALYGAKLVLTRGAFDLSMTLSRESRLSRNRATLTAAVVGFGSVLIHLAAVLFLDAERSDQLKAQWSAMVWIEQMAAAETFVGALESLHTTQFGERMEIRFTDSTTDSAVMAIQEIVGGEYKVEALDTSSILISRGE
jgi:hypothetical protein